VIDKVAHSPMIFGVLKTRENGKRWKFDEKDVESRHSGRPFCASRPRSGMPGSRANRGLALSIILRTGRARRRSPVLR
jgi:hypothetical protein